MPGKKEDLRHAEAQPDPDLNFTYNELLEELKAEFCYAEREPDDVTPREMAEVTNLTERHWFTILNRKVKRGELIRVLVKGKEDRNSYFVYRKVKDE